MPQKAYTVNTDTRTYKLNEAAVRNMSNQEFLRFVEDSSDPVVRELARRLGDLAGQSYNEELSKIADALDALCSLASDISATVEDLEDAWN